MVDVHVFTGVVITLDQKNKMAMELAMRARVWVIARIASKGAAQQVEVATLALHWIAAGGLEQELKRNTPLPFERFLEEEKAEAAAYLVHRTIA